jgi:hypothetical protein
MIFKITFADGSSEWQDAPDIQSAITTARLARYRSNHYHDKNNCSQVTKAEQESAAETIFNEDMEALATS